MKKRILFTVLSMLAVLACKKEPMLDTGTDRLDFGPEGGSMSFTLTANNPWTISESAGWFSVSPESGEAGTATVTVTVVTNIYTDDRSSNIDIHSEGLLSSISICQESKKEINLSVGGSTAVTVPGGGETLKVDVTSNVDYTVSTPDSWVRTVSSKGLTSSVVYLEVAANDTYSSRETTVSFADSKTGTTSRLMITQEQNNGIILGSSTCEVGEDGGQFEVDLKANVTYSAECSASWITESSTKSLRDYHHTFSVAANDSWDERIAYVTFIDIKTDTYARMTVVQEACSRKVILLPYSDTTFAYQGGSAAIRIQSNMDYECRVPEDCAWLKAVVTKGLDESSVTLSCEKNQSSLMRMAQIEFVSGDVKEVLTVYQSGCPLTFEFTHTITYFPFPTFMGTSVSGKILWGDGNTASYPPSGTSRLKYMYSTPGEHTVTVEMSGVETVALDSLSGIISITLPH